MEAGKLVISVDIKQLEKAKQLIIELRKLGLSKRALKKIIKVSREENNPPD